MNKKLIYSLIGFLFLSLVAFDLAYACSLCGCRAKKARKTQSHGHKHSGDIRLDPAVATISTAGLKALLDARTPLTLVDARFGKWDDGARIKDARTANVQMSDKEIKRALPFKHKLIITYCSNLKCPASAKLAKKLSQMGYKNVIEYPYGIDGWRKAGYLAD